MNGEKNYAVSPVLLFRQRQIHTRADRETPTGGHQEHGPSEPQAEGEICQFSEAGKRCTSPGLWQKSPHETISIIYFLIHLSTFKINGMNLVVFFPKKLTKTDYSF